MVVWTPYSVQSWDRKCIESWNAQAFTNFLHCCNARGLPSCPHHKTGWRVRHMSTNDNALFLRPFMLLLLIVQFSIFAFCAHVISRSFVARCEKSGTQKQMQCKRFRCHVQLSDYSSMALLNRLQHHTHTHTNSSMLIQILFAQQLCFSFTFI
jgi:hypothetical protein